MAGAERHQCRTGCAHGLPMVAAVGAEYGLGIRGRCAFAATLPLRGEDALTFPGARAAVQATPTAGTPAGAAAAATHAPPGSRGRRGGGQGGDVMWVAVVGAGWGERAASPPAPPQRPTHGPDARAGGVRGGECVQLSVAGLVDAASLQARGYGLTNPDAAGPLLGIREQMEAMEIGAPRRQDAAPTVPGLRQGQGDGAGGDQAARQRLDHQLEKCPVAAGRASRRTYAGLRGPRPARLLRRMHRGQAEEDGATGDD